MTPSDPLVPVLRDKDTAFIRSPVSLARALESLAYLDVFPTCYNRYLVYRAHITTTDMLRDIKST